MSTVFERLISRAEVEVVEEPAVTTARGHPYALGMLGIAGAAFTVGAYDAEWIPATTALGVQGISLILGALLPIIAGVLLFTALRGEGELGTAYSLIGGYFLSSVVLERLFIGSLTPLTDIATFMGMAMLVFAVAAAYLMFSLWAKHPGASIMSGFFGASLVLLAVGQWATSTNWTIAGGYGLMVVAVVAFAMVAVRRFPGLLGR